MTEFSFSNPNDPQAFLSDFSREVDKMVKAKMDTMSSDDMVACVRDIVGTLHSGGLIQAELTEHIQVAVEAQFIAKMFLRCFDAAYTSTSNHLDNIKNLKKAWEL